MSDKRLLVLILDALDEYNIYQLNLEYIQQLYEKEGDILGISTLPHTALSNPMIWGGVENEDKFWVEKEGETGAESVSIDTEQQWVDPARYFDREEGEPVEGAKGFSREDYAGESFIWDDLHAEGYDARALQVPIVLPPYSFRTENELEDSWFPDIKERMADHIRKKPELIIEELEDGAEFLATSIQMPDKWLHGIGENKCSEEWVQREAPVLDSKVKQVVEYCEQNGVEWVIFGDHGSPVPGAMKKNGYILPRHRKESIIISSDGLEPPVYTGELYRWFLELFDAEPVDPAKTDFREDAELEEEVRERLENLGYR